MSQGKPVASVLDGGSVSVPFQFATTEIPLVMIEGGVNGRGPFRFILDTGNALCPVMLSKSTALELQLDFAPEPVPDSLFKVGDSHPMDHANLTLDRLHFGAFERTGLECMVTSAIDHLSEQIGAPIHGNIGFPLLSEFAIMVDYGAMQFVMGPSEPSGTGIPFRLGSDPLILVDVALNGVVMPFVLDTGAGGTALSEGAAKQLGLPQGDRVPMLGAGGADEGWLSKLSTLGVGEHVQEDVDVVVCGFLPQLSEGLGELVEGIVGFNFLKHYAVTIDYPALRLRLRPL